MISHYHNYFIVPLQGRHQEITMSTCKNFKLVDPESPGPSTSQHPSETNWKLCIICQKDKAEQLTHPSQSKITDAGSGYTSLTEKLVKFSELGLLPWTLQLERLNERCGIKAATVTHNAQYHHTCRFKFTNTMLSREKNRRRRQTVSAKMETNHLHAGDIR